MPKEDPGTYYSLFELREVLFPREVTAPPRLPLHLGPTYQRGESEITGVARHGKADAEVSGYAQSSHVTSGTSWKCLSRVTKTKPCCKESVAIQRSFSGIGQPFRLRFARIRP